MRKEDAFVVNKFKGEIFCSRYGIHADFYKDPTANTKLINMIHLIDGSRTVADIARGCGFTIQECADLLDLLEEKGLICYSDQPLQQ